MSETKHTPGPWKWKGEPGRSHLSAREHEEYEGVLGYADFEGMWPSTHRNEEDAANMRLIAAAPDLLEALKSWIERECHGEHCGDTLHDVACAAIAKAEGRDA